MIYFIQQGGNGPIKIGYTDQTIERRMTTLQIACPEELNLLAKIDGTPEDERVLHKRFKADKIRGEWYNPSNNILSYLFPVPEIAPDFPIPDKDEIKKNGIELWQEIKDMTYDRGYSLDYFIFHLLVHELKRWKAENNATTGLK